MYQSKSSIFLFFFNDTATTEIYTLSLHDALPISAPARRAAAAPGARLVRHGAREVADQDRGPRPALRRIPERHRLPAQGGRRSEEHTSELQSRQYLVCRLLLEKKKKSTHIHTLSG